jgi:segregation and condensation protein A
MTYHVNTTVFEGPLDLLLQLITRRQVDITALSLADLVTEYLSFLEEMRRLDLDVTSEFLLIAATLIQLKVRHLLPSDAELDVDEELALMEERDRLLARLLACVTYKDVAAVLALRMQEAQRSVPRTAGLDQDIPVPAPAVVLPVDGPGLAALASRILSARRAEPDLDHLDLELPSVQAALDELRVRVSVTAETTFDELVGHCTRRVEVAAYFLALLELARWGIIEVAQDDWLSEIRVRHRPEAGAAVVASEWAP